MKKTRTSDLYRALVLSALLFFCHLSYSAELSGTVIDGFNRPLSGIRLSLENRVAYTDEFGQYLITGVSPGNQQIAAFSGSSGMKRSIMLTEGSNRYSFVFRPDNAPDSGKDPLPPSAPYLNIYGLAGGVEVFSSSLLKDDQRLFVLYSRIDRDSDYVYNAFHFNACFRADDNLSIALSLVNSERVSTWFRNRKTLKSISAKYVFENTQIALGGSAIQDASYLFLAHDHQLGRNEFLSFNLNSKSGNLRKAALNTGYTRKLDRFTINAEAIMTDSKYRTFNLGLVVPYQDCDCFAYYRRDNGLSSQSGGLGLQLSW